MAKTRVFVTKDGAEAVQTATFWKNTPGMHVAVAGPTDKIELAPADGGSALWNSADPGPWYMVVATPDSLI